MCYCEGIAVRLQLTSQQHTVTTSMLSAPFYFTPRSQNGSHNSKVSTLRSGVQIISIFWYDYFCTSVFPSSTDVLLSIAKQPPIKLMLFHSYCDGKQHVRKGSK